MINNFDNYFIELLGSWSDLIFFIKLTSRLPCIMWVLGVLPGTELSGQWTDNSQAP